MRHEEADGLLAARALDAVPAGEAEALDCHVESCARCRLELSEHLETAALLGQSTHPIRSHDWSRIEAALSGARPKVDP